MEDSTKELTGLSRRHFLRNSGLMAGVLFTALGMAGYGCSNNSTTTDNSITDTTTTDTTTPEEPVATTHIVTDAFGNDVEVPLEVKSIVVPFPAATQTVLGMGGADLITGGYILNTDMNRKMFGTYMDKITQISPSTINQEIVLQCNPDVMIVTKGMVDTISSLGIPYLQYSGTYYEDLENVADMVASTLNTDRAYACAKYYREFTDDLQKTVGDMTASRPDDDKPVVYVNTEDDPLGTHGAGSSTINVWVNLSGGKYVPELLNLEGGEIYLTSEQLISADPDIIICVTVTGRDALLANDAYANIKAVKNGQVYLAPLGGSVWFKGHFEAPLMMTWAPKIISPDYTADLDTRSLAADFYKNCYGYTITDEDWEVMMNPPVGSR